MLATVGGFQILDGLAAVRDDEVYVAGVDYVWKLDLTTWGWIHMLIGADRGGDGARPPLRAGLGPPGGLGIAVLISLAQFMFLPYYPFWAITMIAMSIGVMWALCVGFGRD